MTISDRNYVWKIIQEGYRVTLHKEVKINKVPESIQRLFDKERKQVGEEHKEQIKQIEKEN